MIYESAIVSGMSFLGLILGLAAWFIMVYQSDRSGGDFWDKVVDYFILPIIFSLAGALISGLISITGLAIYANFVEYDEVEEHYVYIESINRGSDVEGSFILGSGTVENESYYYFYYESIHGYKLSKISAENAYIVETSNKRPKIVEVVKDYDDEAFIKLENSYEPIRTIIYVPKNTVVKDYHLN